MNKNNSQEKEAKCSKELGATRDVLSTDCQETDTDPSVSRPGINICSCSECMFEKGVKAERERILTIMESECLCHVCLEHFDEITEGSTHE